jgi:competence protein ComFC
LLKTSIINFLKDAAMPPVCAVCGQISADSLCPECMAGIKPISSLESCSRCGKPLSASLEGRCGMCRRQEYHFTSHRSYAVYAGSMKKIISEFKYGRVYGLKDILAGFLSEVYDRYFYGKGIDYVDTVPGEHMDLIAGSFSRVKRIPFAANIIRLRKPRRQGELGLAERRLNILDCYKIRDCLAIRNRNILLIDDVWTTGSTLNEICRITRQAGAGNIYLITLARGA